MSRAVSSERPTSAVPAGHRRRWALRTLLAVVVVVAAIAGGPWAYARFFAPQTPEPLALSTPAADAMTSPSPSPPPPSVDVVELDGTWLVGEGSEAGYRLGEVLSGQEVTVVGRTDEVTGSAEVADGVLTAAEFQVDASTISTDESARDAYFRRALDTSEFPHATFTLTEEVEVAGLAESTAVQDVTAQGTVTLRGEEVEATAELEVQRTGEGVEVVGQVPIVLEDFGMQPPDLGFVTVEPDGLIEMRLLLTR